MTEIATKPRGAALVGSVPLDSAEAVFRAAAGSLGQHLKRVPDGETGERATWIVWQGRFFGANPAFEVEEPPPGQYAPLPRYRLKDPAAAATLEFSDGIGYAAVAKDSYAVFKRLKQDGVLPAAMRFQVSLPTPLAPITQFVSRRDQAAVEPAYERQMLRELDEICTAIPHDELAIQWDVAIEMGIWERLGGLFEIWFDDVESEIVTRLARLAEATPADVEVGFHLCYGDFGHEHFKDPSDAGNLVAVANAITAATSRPINWIHMPVPRDRSDEAYFEPLAELQLQPETELYLGLVHMTDGAEGTEARIAAAHSTVSDFGVATECGFGRRPAETVGALLELHSAVADPAA
jgi:hypothetical protein